MVKVYFFIGNIKSILLIILILEGRYCLLNLNKRSIFLNTDFIVNREVYREVYKEVNIKVNIEVN
jgi:hypothetical protein